MHLGLVGDQLRQHARLPDRLVGEVLPDPVAARGGRRALREHQVEDVQHRCQPLAALVGRRHLERDLGRAERLLRAGDPGLDRGRRHQERPRDLVAGQTADHAQRHRDLRLARQDRVARDEHQRQHVVVDVVRVPQEVVAHALAQVTGEGRVPLVERDATAVRVHRAPPCHRDQPRRRAGRDPIAGPRHQGRRQRLLCEVLRQAEVAGGAGEGRDDARGLDPPHRLDRVPPGPRPTQSWPARSRHARSFWIHSFSCGKSSMLVTRRISVFWPGPVIGARLAHSTASSLDATSRIQ